MTSSTICTGKTTPSAALLNTINLALDVLETRDTHQTSPLVLFLPSRYLIRTLGGTLPSLQEHDLHLSTRTRMKHFPNLHLCWLPQEIRCTMRTRCVRLARKAERTRKMQAETRKLQTPLQWKRDPMSPKSLARCQGSSYVSLGMIPIK